MPLPVYQGQNDLITGNFQYTFSDIMEKFAGQFRDLLFFCWIVYFIYIYVEKHKTKIFDERDLKAWDEYSFSVICSFVLLYPVVYLYSGYWIW